MAQALSASGVVELPGNKFLRWLGPRAPHDGIFVGPDSDIDADPTDGPGDDLDGELLSPLERSWPREPETWGRRSVIRRTELW